MKKIKDNCLGVLKKLYKNKNFNIYLIITIMFAFMVFMPFILNGYFLGDDTLFHLANIDTMGKSPLGFLGKIVPSIANDMGYGIGIFYPCLPHSIGGFVLFFISKLGFTSTSIAAIKVVKFIIIMSSALFMYKLSSKIFKSKRIGMISSILYISSSYFIVDSFQRDALQESCMFIFMPLVFLGLYYLFNENNRTKFYICFITGYVGMMYSHLVMSLWFTIILIPFLLIFIKDILKKENIKAFILASVSILILTSTFTIPMLEHLLNGDYRIFNDSRPPTLWTYDLIFFFVRKFSGGIGTYLYADLSIVVVILSVITIFKLIRKKIPQDRKKFIIGFLYLGLFGMLMVSFDRFWLIVPDGLKAIQFAWRAQLFVTIGLVMVASESLDIYFSTFKKKYLWIGSLIIVFICIKSFWVDQELVQWRDYVEPNKDVFAIGHNLEYLPQKTWNNLEYYYQRNNDEIIILEGNSDIKVLNNSTPNMKFEVSNIEEEITIELPRLYYLGYEVEDSKGKEVSYTESKYGFIELNIKENGVYKLRYTGTKGYKISMFVKVLLILIFLGFILKKYVINRRSSK